MAESYVGMTAEPKAAGKSSQQGGQTEGGWK